MLSHDIIHSLTFEDPAHIGGPVHQVVADWCRITPTEARRRVKDAAQLSPRVTLTGQELPPELPATAQQWREGLLDAAHLRVIQTFVRNLPTDTPAPSSSTPNNCWPATPPRSAPTNSTKPPNAPRS